MNEVKKFYGNFGIHLDEVVVEVKKTEKGWKILGAWYRGVEVSRILHEDDWDNFFDQLESKDITEVA